TPTTSTTSTVPPTWAAIWTAAIAPNCSGCHGGSPGYANLGGLDDCNTGWAALVNVPSTELSSMDRVEPGAPDSSWLFYKLNGAQGQFDAQCAGGSCGSTMPLNMPQLKRGALDAIRTWIESGAANDCP